MLGLIFSRSAAASTEAADIFRMGTRTYVFPTNEFRTATHVRNTQYERERERDRLKVRDVEGGLRIDSLGVSYTHSHTHVQTYAHL